MMVVISKWLPPERGPHGESILADGLTIDAPYTFRSRVKQDWMRWNNNGRMVQTRVLYCDWRPGLWGCFSDRERRRLTLIRWLRDEGRL